MVQKYMHEKLIWLPIVNCPGYEVSNSGQIRSWRKTGPGNRYRDKPLILKPHMDDHGYLYVTLTNKKGKQCQGMIHRKVLETFVGKSPKGMQCQHLNDVRNDNWLNNLKWGTPKENSQNMIDHGNSRFGEMCHLSKLTRTIIKNIIFDLYQGKLYQKEIAQKYNTTQTNVSSIKLNKTWRHILPEQRNELIKRRNLLQKRRNCD